MMKVATRTIPIMISIGSVQHLVILDLCFAVDDTKKCSKIHNAHEQLVLCSLNLLFGDQMFSLSLPWSVVCLSSQL